MKYILSTVFMIAISTVALADHNKGHVDVTVGELTPRAKVGQQVFNKNCAQCHGTNAEGSPAGPPLIHSIYNPGHHDSNSFYSAVKNGVRQHHWPYGNMPAQPQIGFAEMPAIVVFIRELQMQNGIVTKKHQM